MKQKLTKMAIAVVFAILFLTIIVLVVVAIEWLAKMVGINATLFIMLLAFTYLVRFVYNNLN